MVFDDGLFEVTLIRKPTNPIALQEIIAALLIEQVDTKHMYTFKTGEITFESLEEIPWTLDGEFDEVVIRNMKQQLEIMVPGEHVESLAQPPAELPEKAPEKAEKPEKLADMIRGVLSDKNAK